MKLVGPLSLAVWLILMGLMQAFDIKFENRDRIMGVLALIAGACQLLVLL